MKRGSISNTRLPTLWVISDVLLERGGRLFFIGPQKETLRRTDWLWRVSNDYQVIIIYINQNASSKLNDYEHKRFSSFQEARNAFNVDMRAGLMVVEDDSQAAPPNIVSFQRSVGIF